MPLVWCRYQLYGTKTLWLYPPQLTGCCLHGSSRFDNGAIVSSVNPFVVPETGAESHPHGGASKRLVVESPWSQFTSECQRF
jgi:hypothetical protein|eukprot:COSAG01_NODE_625_length_14726_cov_9.023997_9_plen_82_part_00